MIPGYDFTQYEEVTAGKLTRWLLGTVVDSDSPLNFSVTGVDLPAITTAPSGVSTATEGVLSLNMSTGKVEISTRWGMVPVFGGGMFTKRAESFHGGKPLIFFYARTGLHYSVNGRVTVGSSISELHRGFEYRTVMRTSDIYDCGAHQNIVAYCTLWPSYDNYDPDGNYTEISTSTIIHRLLCLRGFTPIYATAVTTHTNPSVQIAQISARKYIELTKAASEEGQLPWGTPPLISTAGGNVPMDAATSMVHYGYCTPVLGTCSLNAGFPLMNLRP